MKFVKIAVPLFFLGLSGMVMAEETNPEPMQLMHQQREQMQHKLGAMGNEFTQEMRQNQAQMQHRHQYRQQMKDGQGLRMQNRMAHRMGK